MATIQSALRNTGLSDASDVPEQPSPVVKRELLWSGGVIQIKVPATARKMRLQTPSGEVCYLQFPQLIRGGVVNIHVHADKLDDYLGKKIITEVCVFRKEHENGRSFLYVDMYPMKDDTQVTNRLAVMQMVPGTQFTEGALVFETPAPLQGAIVIVGDDQKFC